MSIGELEQRFPDALAGRVTVHPTEYDQLAKGWADEIASDNFQWVAAGFEAINHFRNKPALSSLNALGVFLRDSKLSKPFMESEAFGHYTQLHHNPALVIYWLSKTFAAKDPVWAEIRPRLKAWLRCLYGWLSIGGCNWKSRILGKDQQVAGPRILKARSETRDTYYFTVMNGQRGTVFYGSAEREWIYAVQKGQNDIYHYFCRGWFHRWYKTLDDAARTVGVYEEVWGPDDRDASTKASENDLNALRGLISAIRGYQAPKQRFEVLRAAGGVSCVLFHAPGSSTCPVMGTTARPTGETDVAVKDEGYRKSGGGDYVRAGGVTEFDIVNRRATFQRDDKSLPAVTLELAPGELLFHVRSTPENGIEVLVGGDGGVVVPPPTPPPPPDQGDSTVTPGGFLEKIVGRFAGTDPKVPGTFSGFVRTTIPNVYAWCKGLPYPWAIEFLERRADGSLWLLSEAEMDQKNQTVKKYRTFWETSERPGIQWAPSKLVEFGMVRHSWDAPGETEAGPFKTRTAVETTELGMERTDYMAEGGPSAYHEIYRLNLNGPAFWGLYTTSTGVEQTSHTMTVYGTLPAPIRLFGCLPDGTVRWAWSDGGSGELPPEVVVERKPSAAVLPVPASPSALPKKEKSSWIERLLTFLRGIFG